MILYLLYLYTFSITTILNLRLSKISHILECLWDTAHAVPSDCHGHLTSIAKIISTSF